MFRLSDYIFTPKDIFRIIASAWRSFFLGKTFRNIAGGTFLATAYWSLRTVFGLDFESIFFCLFAFTVIWWRFDSRIPIAFALACLVAIPLFLELSRRDIVLQGDDWAETVAVWAYFFLVIGVVSQIFEYRFRETPERARESPANIRNLSWKNHGPHPSTKPQTHHRAARFEMVTLLPKRPSTRRNIDLVPIRKAPPAIRRKRV